MELSWRSAPRAPRRLSARKTPGFPQGHRQQIGEKIETLGPRHLHERRDLIGDLLCALARIFPTSGRWGLGFGHRFRPVFWPAPKAPVQRSANWPRTGMISWRPLLPRRSCHLLSRLPILLRHVAQSGHTASEVTGRRFDTAPSGFCCNTVELCGRASITFAQDDAPSLWAGARSGYRGAAISNRRDRSSWPPRRTPSRR